MAYALLDVHGNINNIIVYDGVAEYSPPAGLTLSEVPDTAQIGGTFIDGVLTNPSQS